MQILRRSLAATLKARKLLIHCHLTWAKPWQALINSKVMLSIMGGGIRSCKACFLPDALCYLQGSPGLLYPQLPALQLSAVAAADGSLTFCLMTMVSAPLLLPYVLLGTALLTLKKYGLVLTVLWHSCLYLLQCCHAKKFLIFLPSITLIRMST